MGALLMTCVGLVVTRPLKTPRRQKREIWPYLAMLRDPYPLNQEYRLQEPGDQIPKPPTKKAAYQALTWVTVLLGVPFGWTEVGGDEVVQPQRIFFGMCFGGMGVLYHLLCKGYRLRGGGRDFDPWICATSIFPAGILEN